MVEPDLERELFLAPFQQGAPSTRGHSYVGYLSVTYLKDHQLMGTPLTLRDVLGRDPLAGALK